MSSRFQVTLYCIFNSFDPFGDLGCNLFTRKLRLFFFFFPPESSKLEEGQGQGLGGGGGAYWFGLMHLLMKLENGLC